MSRFITSPSLYQQEEVFDIINCFYPTGMATDSRNYIPCRGLLPTFSTSQTKFINQKQFTEAVYKTEKKIYSIYLNADFIGRWRCIESNQSNK